MSEQAIWAPVWEGMQGKWMHRKLWEWCAIAQALSERSMLTAGRAGMGFAVGTEPLPSLFASCGPHIIASDLVGASADPSWASTGQLAASLQTVHWPGLVTEPDFKERVRFESVDMRDLSVLPRAQLDFLWSSCAFEHLGSLDAGLQFVEDAMQCLKPGGIAVHTTEYNVSSNDETMSTGDSVIYRQRDIEAFARRLRLKGCVIEDLSFDAGADTCDVAFDYPPYYQHGHQHIKLQLHGYISTSILLIIRRVV